MSALRRLLEAPPAGRSAAAAPPGPLSRFLEPRPAAGKRCQLCAAPLEGGHRHVVDLARQGLRCSCRGCALLLGQPGAARGRYRVVPERYLRLEPFVLAPDQWAALQVPVGMAFFLPRSGEGRTVAFYPSPGGATESQLALDAWDEVVAANSALRTVEVDTEAALVRLSGAAPSCHIVPVDRCYELVGELRLHWRGFDGGPQVRERIVRFFEGVDARSRPSGAAS